MNNQANNSKTKRSGDAQTGYPRVKDIKILNSKTKAW